MTSTLPPIIQAFSGAIGSASANAIAYPLDLVATRLQTTSSRKLTGLRGIVLTLRHILRTEGWTGLYDGLGTDTLATLLSNFLYFYFYSFLRTLMVQRKLRHAPLRATKGKNVPLMLSVPEELGIGFLAGVTSRAISMPLNLITVRLQMETEGDDEQGEMNATKGKPEEEKGNQQSRGVILTMQKIYKEEGLYGFWRGFSTAIPLSLNPAVTLFLFQIYRKLLSRYSPEHSSSRNQKIATPSASAAFLGAAFSNTIATALLYPLILAKTRLQVHRKNGEGHMDMLRVWQQALRKEGLQGLYQGLDAQVLKGFVNQGVTMMVKQRVELLIVALYLRSLKR